MSERMTTAYPGNNPQGSQVQIKIPHPKVQQAISADPVESAEALHDVRAINEEGERLKLENRGHAKILFHKLRMLDDKLRDVVAMREAENKEAVAGAEDSKLSNAQNLIRGAQDLLAATQIEKKYHWESLHASHELPSQRAMAAAERARVRLHAKWLRSHPWATHMAHFNAVHSQTLAARPGSRIGVSALQAAVGDFGMNEGPAGHTPGLAGYVQPGVQSDVQVPHQQGVQVGMQQPAGGVLLRPDAYSPTPAQTPQTQQQPLPPQQQQGVDQQPLSPLQVAAAGQVAGSAQQVCACVCVSAHFQGPGVRLYHLWRDCLCADCFRRGPRGSSCGGSSSSRGVQVGGRGGRRSNANTCARATKTCVSSVYESRM